MASNRVQLGTVGEAALPLDKKVNLNVCVWRAFVTGYIESFMCIEIQVFESERMINTGKSKCVNEKRRKRGL